MSDLSRALTYFLPASTAVLLFAALAFQWAGGFINTTARLAFVALGLFGLVCTLMQFGFVVRLSGGAP